MQIVLIDHDDSFTHILAQFLGMAGRQSIGGAEALPMSPIVLNHKDTSLEEVKNLNPTHLVLSPGPGHPDNPEDFRIGKELLAHFEGKIPILGVCLGHQGIASFYGANVKSAPRPMHGKRSLVQHKEKSLFTGIKNPLEVMRYHSLAVTELPETLEALAWTSHDTDDTDAEVLMAFAHKENPVFGLQFHPESMGTEDGLQLIRNFLGF